MSKLQKCLKSKGLIALFIAGFTGFLNIHAILNQAHGAGFEMKSQTPDGIATSFSGSAAKSYDASTVFFNPAGMSFLESSQAQINIIGVIPFFRYQHKANKFNAPSLSAEEITDVSEIKLNDKETGGVSFSAFPTMSMAYQLSDKIHIGASFNVPFATSLEFDEKWVGAQTDGMTKVQALRLTPSISFALTPDLSLGGSVFYQHISSHNKQYIFWPSVDENKWRQDYAEMTSSDSRLGWAVGAVYSYDDDSRVGFSFRSSVSHHLSGWAELSDIDIPQPSKAEISELTLSTPYTLSLGLHHQLNDLWTLLVGIDWVGWSIQDQATLTLSNPWTKEDVDPLEIDYKWSDALFISFGGIYQYDENIQLKLGGAYDPGVSSIKYRSASSPDTSRFWISGGGSYQLDEHLQLDVGFSHLFSSWVDLDVSAKTTYSTIDFKDANPNGVVTNFESSYQGKIHGSITFMSMGLNYKF